MSSDRRRAARGVLLLALLVSLGAAGAVASPPPRPICPVCGDAFEEADADGELDLSVGESEVVIAVRADGSARWTVTNALEDGETAERLRERPDELQSLVVTAIENDHWDRPAADSIAGIETAIDGDGDVTIEFRQSGFADRRVGGVLLSEYFYVADEGFGYERTVDRLEIRPPEEYRFANRPDAAETSARSVVWEERAPGDVYLAMAEGDGAGAALAARIAIAAETAPYVLANIGVVLPGALLFGGLVWGLGRVRSAGPFGRKRLGVPLVAVGALLVVHPLVAPALGLLGSPAWPLVVVGATYLGAGALALSRAGPVEPDRLLAVPVGAALAVGVGLLIASVIEGAGLTGAWGRTLLPAAAALPASLLLFYGGTRASGAARRAFQGVVGAFLWFALWWQWPFAPPGGLVGLGALLIGLGAVASAVGGAPLYLLGLELGRGDSVDEA